MSGLLNSKRLGFRSGIGEYCGECDGYQAEDSFQHGGSLLLWIGKGGLHGLPVLYSRTSSLQIDRCLFSR